MKKGYLGFTQHGFHFLSLAFLCWLTHRLQTLCSSTAIVGMRTRVAFKLCESVLVLNGSSRLSRKSTSAHAEVSLSTTIPSLDSRATQNSTNTDVKCKPLMHPSCVHIMCSLLSLEAWQGISIHSKLFTHSKTEEAGTGRKKKRKKHWGTLRGVSVSSFQKILNDVLFVLTVTYHVWKGHTSLERFWFFGKHLQSWI